MRQKSATFQGESRQKGGKRKMTEKKEKGGKRIKLEREEKSA